MKFLCELFYVFVILQASNAADLVRRKRFFDSLWPSEEIKSDVQNGLTYAQLPAEYLYLLQGVNDNKLIQRRAGVQPSQQQQAAGRFVHPTRMAILMQPHYLNHQVNVAQPANLKNQPANLQPQALGPKIVMKPVAPNLNPSITLKTREQSLPELHKNQRFVTPKPLAKAAQKPLIQTFNVHQQLPIRKAFDVAPSVISSSIPLLTIKTAAINDFYYTKEFQELLKEFNIKVEIKNLPAISDVMSILGTEDAEETLASIRDVAKSKEGMELIKSYLDQNTDRVEDDEFYNYDEDVGTGEIKVDGSEDIQSYQAPQSNFGIPQQQIYRIPSQHQPPATQVNKPLRPTTTGTLTGSGNAGKSWWKPTTWFSLAPSTKVEALQKDAAILKNVVPIGGVQQNLQYIRNFLTPTSRDSVPVDFPRRMFLQQPLKFQHSSVIEADTKLMPTVQMSEAQFQDMIKTLKLTPVNTQKSPQIINQPIFTPQTPKQSEIAQTKFQSPINVQNSRTGIPLPSTFEPQPLLETPEEVSPPDNRRNFISLSEPQRATPYDFIATGRVHQANPDEVLKRSRSLAEAVEVEKSVVAAISDLTELHQTYY